jgi:DNA-binding CsgD family transcriptional regulator
VRRLQQQVASTAGAVPSVRECWAAAEAPNTESRLASCFEVPRGVPLGSRVLPLGAVLRELCDDVCRARDCSARLDVLSHRGREVLRRVDGEPVSQIAVESVVSTSTVRTHVRSILTKSGVRSRVEAISVARSAGLRPAADWLRTPIRRYITQFRCFKHSVPSELRRVMILLSATVGNSLALNGALTVICVNASGERIQ